MTHQAPGLLLRLVVPQPQFLGDDGLPSWRALRPTRGDYKDAKESGTPVSVSVWDLEMATVVQAEAFLPPKPRAPFTLTSADVADSATAWNDPRVRVVRLPITDEPRASMPGAAAHCGIEGLEQHASETEPQHSIRLAFLTARLQALHA